MLIENFFKKIASSVLIVVGFVHLCLFLVSPNDTFADDVCVACGPEGAGADNCGDGGSTEAESTCGCGSGIGDGDMGG